MAADSERIYLFPSSARLRVVDESTPLFLGGIRLSEKDLDEAVVFERGSVIIDKGMTLNEVVGNKLWLAALSGDEDLLGRYASEAFRLGKEMYGFDTLMGFCAPEDSQLVMRSVVLRGLDIRSIAYGGNWSLGGSNVHLVGVKREAVGGSAGLERDLEEVIVDA